MPHCILEYSSNIPLPPEMRGVLRSLHQALVETGLFKLNDIKSRAIRRDDFLIGDGDGTRTFVALEIQIFTGRDAATRKAIAQKAMEILQKAFAPAVEETPCSLSVQVTEMDREVYLREGPG